VNLSFSVGLIRNFSRFILQKCVLSDSFLGSLLQVQSPLKPLNTE